MDMQQRWAEEIWNKCDDLGVDVQRFLMADSVDTTSTPSSAFSSASDAASTASLTWTTRMDWVEFCFFLSFQLDQLVLSPRGRQLWRFPVELPLRQRQLWPSKKQKAVLATLEQLQKQQDSGAAGAAAAAGGASSSSSWWWWYPNPLEDATAATTTAAASTPTGKMRWMLVSDFFLSELQQLFIECWRQPQEPHVPAAAVSGIHGQVVKEDAQEAQIIHSTLEPLIRNLETLCAIERGGEPKRHQEDQDQTIQDEEALACWLDSCCATLRTLSQTAKQTSSHHAATSELDAASMAKLEQFHQCLHQDFTLRKALMKERCEVTLQSFFWANQIRKNPELEEELQQEINKIKQNCHTEPIHVDLKDFVAQSGDFVEFGLVGKKTTCKLEEGASLRSVLMGQVPDRGGRTEEIRPKQFLRGAAFIPGKSSNSNEQHKQTGRKKTKSFAHHHQTKKQKQ